MKKKDFWWVVRNVLYSVLFPFHINAPIFILPAFLPGMTAVLHFSIILCVSCIGNHFVV